MHFTRIGTALPEAIVWPILVVGLIGMLASLIPGKKWGGRLFALAVAAGAVCHAPIALLAGGVFLLTSIGASIDLVHRSEKTGKALRKQVFVQLAMGLCFCCMQVWTATEKQIDISGNELSSNLRFHPASNGTRGQLAEYASQDKSGRIYGWAFHGKAGEGEYVASVSDLEVYWDGRLGFLNGQEVARRLETWAGVKPTLDGHFDSEVALR